MSVYNIKVDVTSYNDEFHALAIWKLGAFLPNSVLAIGSDSNWSSNYNFFDTGWISSDR